MKNEHYSCKYSNSLQNFVLLNLPEGNIDKYSKEYSIFCIIRNILQRGIITPPSMLLREQLGEIDVARDKYSLSSANLSDWTHTIKGDTETGDKPAETFFEKLLPFVLGEKLYIRNLILPEAKIQDIIKDEAHKFWDQQVDFYFPQIKKVIEIDGASHESPSQIAKDKERDNAFKAAGIETVRIKAFDIKHETAELQSKLAYIKHAVDEEKAYIPLYTAGIDVDSYAACYKYDTVMRCQMLVLSCLMNGCLSVESSKWHIHIAYADIPYIEECFQLACNDINLYFSNLARLLKLDIQFPKIEFVKSGKNADISINYSLFSKYDDRHKLDADCIYVRNDYYDDKSYYEVACGELLRYELNIDKDDTDSDRETLKYFLHNLFFVEDFRNGQLPIIANILSGNDTIGIMPTGGGKSLCYQLCAFLQPGITIIVVPIIALMHDQRRGLNARYIDRCTSISSEQTGAEKDQILKDMTAGKYQFIFISPERFQNAKFRKQIATVNQTRNIALSVIDEVHCLSEWGHNFRVSYLQLVHSLREYCPASTLVGLTATASNAVLTDLKAEFEFTGAENIKALDKVMRDELVFVRKSIPSKADKIQGIQGIISELKSKLGDNLFERQEDDTTCGLLFSPTVNGYIDGCEALRQELCKIEGMSDKITVFHSQLPQEAKDNAQEAFMQNQFPIMICTNAFGMGIDKSNIRYTVHCALPQSMESFYQEAGRAGRGEDKSQKSYCYILYAPDNASKEVISTLFDAKTQPSERTFLREKHFNQCDLGTIMYLLGNGKHDINEEYESIRIQLKKLKSQREEGQPYVILFSNEKECQAVQEALNKMFLLGIIKGWTVEYQTKNSGRISIDGFEVDPTGENEKQRLIEYIRKYERDFTLEKSEYFSIYSKYKKKPVEAAFRVLIQWSNEHIYYSRLQSTYNMREICGADKTEEDFRKALEDYFKYSDETIKFDNIVEAPNEYICWLDLLYAGSFEQPDKTRIDKSRAAAALGALRRYLETYRSNTGLNYLCGMLRLYIDEYDKTEGPTRLDMAFQSISRKLSIEDQDTVIVETLTFAKIFDINCKNYLSEMLQKHYPERVSQIYAVLHDQASLIRIIKRSTQQLKSLTEEHEVWLLTMSKN